MYAPHTSVIFHEYAVNSERRRGVHSFWENPHSGNVDAAMRRMVALVKVRVCVGVLREGKECVGGGGWRSGLKGLKEGWQEGWSAAQRREEWRMYRQKKSEARKHTSSRNKKRVEAVPSAPLRRLPNGLLLRARACVCACACARVHVRVCGWMCACARRATPRVRGGTFRARARAL